MIPLPFSFAIACAAIAVFTSKLQYPPTHLLLALHSISSPLCLAAIYCILWETLANPTDLLVWISVGLFGALNLLGTIAQACIFTGDASFTRWTRAGSQKPNYSIYAFWFIFVTLIAALGGFQFQNIIFCRLFNFSCFKAQLKSTQTFRVCHLLNFLAYAPQIIIVYAISTALQNVSAYSLKMVLIDSLIITVINMFLAIFVSRKDDNFFSEIENGLHINKVTCLNEDDNTLVYMQESQNKIKSLPDILEFDEFGYCTTKRNRSIKRSFKKATEQSNAPIHFQEEQGDQYEESRKDKTQSVEEKTQSEMELKQNQMEQEVYIVDDAFKQSANVGAQDVGQVDRYSQQGQKVVVKVETADAASQTIREVKVPNIMIIQQDYVEESEITSDKQDQIFQNHSIVKEQPLAFSGLQRSPQIKLHESNPKNELEELHIYHQKQAISEQFYSLDSSNLEESKKQLSFQRSKTINKIKKPYELFINRQALIESQSSFTNTETVRRQLQHQQLLNQEQAKAKALFKKTASKHRSPPKIISKDDRQQLIFHVKNHNLAKISEPNAQMPIKQKNLRGKIGPNHPMNEQQSNYPLKRTKRTEEYSCIDDDESNRQAKRQNLRAPKSTIDHHNYQSSEISHKQQPKNYNTFNLQPDLIQAQTSEYKKFTRSNFNSMAGLFTRLKKNDVCQSEIMTIDIPPDQPTRDSTNYITPSQHLANLFPRNGVRSAPKGRLRPQTSKEKEVGRRFNQQKKLGIGLESKKMNSLEKIYLQRLNNF